MGSGLRRRKQFRRPLLAVLLALAISPALSQSWWREHLTRFRLAPYTTALREADATGDWRSALLAAERILAIDPARTEIRLRKLQLLYEHQQYGDALRTATRLDHGPAAHQARYIAGLIYFETGRIGDAEAVLREAAADGRLTAPQRQRAKRLLERIALSRTYIGTGAPRLVRYDQPPPPPTPTPPVPGATPPRPAPSPPFRNIPPPTPGQAMEDAFRALDAGRAEDALAALDTAAAQGAGPIVDLYRGYALLRLSRPAEAQEAFRRAADAESLDATKRAAAWAQIGYLAAGRQDSKTAINAFRRAIDLAGPTSDLLLQLGYAQVAAGDWRAAVTTLERAAALNGGTPQLMQDIAYAARNAGAPDKAAYWFRKALEHGGQLSRERQLSLKREVEWLEDRFDASLYSAFRGNAMDADSLNPLERSVLQSQGGLGLAYIPPGMGRKTGRFAALSGRLFWSYEKDSLAIPSSSWQAGLGIAIRPLMSDNLLLGAERLVAVGRDARDDWLFRAGYSWSHMDGASPWPDARLYLDGALIDPASPDLLATGSIEIGKRIEPSAQLRLWPHLVAAGNWQDDDFGSVRLLEGGPGLTATLDFDEGTYRAYRASLSLSLQYRVKLAGNSAGHSGPLLTISLQR